MSRRRSRGLTLIEVIVVITIVSMLMGVVGVYALRQLVESRKKIARLDVRNAVTALDTWRVTTGRFPDPRDGFAPLVASKVLRELPRDPWGNVLSFSIVDGEPVVVSYGSDGKPGGEDEAADLSSLTAEP